MKKLLVFQHIEREHPSTIALYATERGVGLDVVKVWEGDAVPEVAGYDGLVILGGPMGVYDDYPGKDAELAVIRANIGKVPMFGICLGAQLLAHALGGNVFPHVRDGKRIKEIGYYDVTRTSDGASCKLLEGLPETMKVLQWHGDTFNTPEGARRTATGALCENQAFCNNNIHGFQFHVEATPELVDELLQQDSAWASDGFELDEKRIREEARAFAPLMREQCFRIMDNFLSI